MKKYKKILWIILAILAILALYFFVFSRISAEELQGMIASSGDWAPLVYIGVFTLLPAFFFPVAVLALAGGLLFGLWLGSIYTLIGAVLNCALMFLLARHVGRKQIEALIQQKLSPAWQSRLAAAGGQKGFLLLIILRLIPAVPYNLINYAFGLTKMSFPVYMLASVIGIIPGTLVFINIGDKALDVSSPSFWVAIGLLVLLLAVTALLGKKLFPHTANDNEGECNDGTDGKEKE